jgi:hypothetical protein
VEKIKNENGLYLILNSFLIASKKNLNDENLNKNFKKSLELFRTFILFLISNKSNNIDYYNLFEIFYETYLNI